MSQEYTEDKAVTLKKLSSGQRMLEAVLVVVTILAAYLMVALFSFDPSDPSWSQTAWHEPINNLGGTVGAWIADTLFFVFGVLAYTIPPMMMILCWAAFRHRSDSNHADYFALSLRLIGALALIFTSCSLAALNISDLYYFASGGVIGSLFGNAMLPWFSGIGATLTLLCIWAVGLTLFTGWSWLTIAEKIGGAVLGLVAFMTHRSRQDICYSDEKSVHQSTNEIEENKHLDFSGVNAPLPASNLTDDVLFSAPSVDQSMAEAENELLFSPSHATSEDNRTSSPTERHEPRLGSWDSEPKEFYSSLHSASVQSDSGQLDNTRYHNSEMSINAAGLPLIDVVYTNAAIQAVPFTPVFSATTDNAPQIKQGIGPELPRPNPVRIPTRRELASYGIKLPSQRMAEPENKGSLQNVAHSVSSTQSDVTLQEEALQHAMLQKAFDEQQIQRYGAEYQYDQTDIPNDVQPISQKEQATARQQTFSPPQQGRYASQPPESESLNDSLPIKEKEESPSHLEKTSGEDDSVTSFSVPAMDSLIHPFLIRNDQPLHRPTTPLPTLDLLASPPTEAEPIDRFALEQTARLVEARLGDYRIKAEVVEISPGPVITRFELDLAPGLKAARISNLSRDLARSLSAIAVRVVEVIPGKPYVGLELPNKHRQTVYLREVLDCAKFRETTSPLAIVLGKDIAGQPVIADLAKMPHLLVAGTTGSGKSVGVNAMILSILYKATPEEVRFIMIDPKMLELSVYEGIPHLLTEVVTDMKDAANALRWCVAEMERRYKLMSALGVRNLAGYNERVEQAEAMGRPIPDPFWKPSESMELSPPMLEKLPYIVVMVDEFADLMMTVGKKVEELIARLAQKARAAGIHLVLATQRPSVDVITGLIKANIPTRIAFTVSSKIDSRTILDQGGAESLLGMGDMLYMAPNSSIPIRVHGAFVRDQEVHTIVNDWKARGRPQYIDSILNGSEEGEGGSVGLDSDEVLDPLFDQAVSFVVEKRRASISGVQRQFRIGYNRAARIIEQMEAQQIVSTPGHNGNREVLAPSPHE